MQGDGEWSYLDANLSALARKMRSFGRADASLLQLNIYYAKNTYL